MTNIHPDRPTIELSHVSKVYRTYPSPRHRLMEFAYAGRKRYARETRALDDVSLSLESGGRLGIVGTNGSGKSTLLKVLAGVLTPTSGVVHVRGRVSALLELGAGFNAELPGRENIRQFCMLHGMRGEEVDAAVPDIIQFSELRDVIDHPVKTYSSGMAMRLGFACAVHVQPDILIVDEALSVGDAYFQSKCLHNIRSMLDRGTAFIYVTHAADAIRSLCNEALWLESGRVRMSGASAQVGAAYQREVFSRLVRAGFKAEEATENEETATRTSPTERTVPGTDAGRQKAFAERVAPLRTGSAEIRVVDIELIDEHGGETDTIPFEGRARVRVYFEVLKPTSGNVAVTLGVFDKNGGQIMHFNSLVHGVDVSTLAERNTYAVEFSFACPLVPGEYGLAAGVSEMKKSLVTNAQMITDSVIDYCVGGARFSVMQPAVTDNRDLWGICYAHCDVSVVCIG